MKLARRTVIGSFFLLAVVWLGLFVSDAGNFWHGGSVTGLIAMESASVLGTLAYVDVLRSDVLRMAKVMLAVVAAPLALSVVFSLSYAVRYLLPA